MAKLLDGFVAWGDNFLMWLGLGAVLFLLAWSAGFVRVCS